MNMKARKPLPKAKQRVDISQAETILCTSCNNSLFIESYVLKRVSAIVSPTGQEAIVPIQVFACGSCGELKNLSGTPDTDLVG